MKGLVCCMLVVSLALSSSVPRTRDRDRVIVLDALKDEMTKLREDSMCDSTSLWGLFDNPEGDEFDHMLDVINTIFNYLLSNCPDKAKPFSSIFERIFTLTSDSHFISPGFKAKYPWNKESPVAIVLNEIWNEVGLRYKFLRAEVFIANNMIWFAAHSHAPGVVLHGFRNLQFFIGGSAWRYSARIIEELPQLWQGSNFQVAWIPITDPHPYFWGTRSEIDAYSFFKESLSAVTANLTLSEDFVFPGFLDLAIFLGAKTPQLAVDKIRKLRPSAKAVWDEVLVLMTNFWMYRKHYHFINSVCPRMLDMTHSFVYDLGTPRIEDIRLWLPFEFGKCAVVLNLVDSMRLREAEDFAIHAVTQGFVPEIVNPQKTNVTTQVALCSSGAPVKADWVGRIVSVWCSRNFDQETRP